MMRTALPVALILAAAFPGLAEPREASIDFQLQGTLVEVGYLADAAAIPVDFDASYALTIRIESCVPANARFKIGSNATFAIHSPALLFMGDPIVGKSYRFSLRQVKTEIGTSFENLAVIVQAPR
jgi:hypothetical protein